MKLGKASNGMGAFLFYELSPEKFPSCGVTT